MAAPPTISPRLAAALGLAPGPSPTALSNGGVEAMVDDVDKRYRDAIKAGATPLEPPRTEAGRRMARLRDASSGLVVTIRGLP